jgi:tRNA modification GTPase
MIREALTSLLADIEAVLNFPEDTSGSSLSGRVGAGLEKALGRINVLLATAQCGMILREGVRVVIAGKPNVGKSSLLNALLRVPRAIVTDMAGTTRDVLEEEANINGIPVNLVDTAGILSPRDKVEEEAVRRSHENVRGADIVLLVLDQSASLDKTDHELLQRIKAGVSIVVLNKTDLPPVLSRADVTRVVPGAHIVEVSALETKGMDALRDAISALALKDVSVGVDTLIVSDVRHIEALRAAVGVLMRAQESVERGTSLEFPAEDIKNAINALDAITGRLVDDDVIDQIFSKFCIGK